MRPGLNLIASVMLGLVSALSMILPDTVSPLLDSLVAGTAPVGATVPTTAIESGLAAPALHFEPIGLSLLRPYVRGKIPAVLVHGLGATPESWGALIERLEQNSVIRNRYQFWTFGYATGQPILYSASLLRQALSQARAQYDPAKSDRAFDQMVLIGYSLGGILARLMSLDSGTILWDQIAAEPADKLRGPADACEALRKSFFFKAVPEVHRIIFIATPHRGSRVDQGALHWIAAQLNQPLDTLRQFHASLVESNEPEFFRESFRQGLASSVDQLAWHHPRLMAFFQLGTHADMKLHSIIPEVDDPPSPGGSDGVVSYASTHLDGVTSELIVHGGHLCLANPRVLSECERILNDNLAVPPIQADLAVTHSGPRGNTLRDPNSGSTPRLRPSRM
jgi:pimeloyl-ACP methyl ester carboxylesterase